MLRRYNVNDFAASVWVYAAKQTLPHETRPINPEQIARWSSHFFVERSDVQRGVPARPGGSLGGGKPAVARHRPGPWRWHRDPGRRSARSPAPRDGLVAGRRASDEGLCRAEDLPCPPSDASIGSSSSNAARPGAPTFAGSTCRRRRRRRARGGASGTRSRSAVAAAARLLGEDAAGWRSGEPMKPPAVDPAGNAGPTLEARRASSIGRRSGR